MAKHKDKVNEWPGERIARNVAALAGVASLLVGVTAFDWRAACITFGVLLLTGSVTGMVYAARKGRQK